MIVLSWNCRGVGLNSTIQELKNVITVERPSLVFVCETKSGWKKSGRLIRKLGFSDACIVPSQGLSGGLWLLWSDLCTVTILYKSSWIIQAEIHESGKVWYFSGIYASPDPVIRTTQWEQLHLFKPPSRQPWLCIGDLNDVLKPKEKRGRVPFSPSKAQWLIQAMNNCELFDIGYKGLVFTWCNGQKGRNRTHERIDRALANVEWRLCFPNDCLYHKHSTESDHKMLVIKPNTTTQYHPRPFWFEAFWLEKTGCQEVIAEAWQPSVRGSASHVLTEKLKICQQKLKWWNKNIFGHLDVAIKRSAYYLENILDKIASLPNPPDALFQEELYYKEEHQKLLRQKEILWAEKSGQMWFIQGELNTRYFHTVVTRRRHKSNIVRLKKPDGSEVTDREQIGNQFVQYYTRVMTMEDPLIDDSYLDVVPSVISNEENQQLLAPVTDKEIFSTLKKMGHFKSPSPDGFQQAHILNVVIDKYCEFSGQQVNYYKSQFIHNKHLSRLFKNALSRRLKVPATTQFPNYLGVPSLLGRSKIDKFQPLIERFQSRLASWKAATLSKGGRLTLA
ncbi:hypothetical protein IFM89_001345 [Coptis chinensis]|uniref:Endonuclease/exonuclease/phosphatase domain-containing protein n=1 Tax=Coptis chinensis TaxID=261450 RepID=A0A835HA85_9MAGN|nr:hypothetical protein IFM89_001345 [Coptis chinensis]